MIIFKTMHMGDQILTPIASALHCCKKMQSRQKISLAGLLEITLAQVVSCGAETECCSQSMVQGREFVVMLIYLGMSWVGL